MIVRLDTDRPEKGILSSRECTILLNVSFLMSQAFWPHLVGPYMQNKSLASALLANLPLWCAALSIIVLTYGTFQAYSHIVPFVAASLVFVVAVFVDGIGWTARSIFKAL